MKSKKISKSLLAAGVLLTLTSSSVLAAPPGPPPTPNLPDASFNRVNTGSASTTTNALYGLNNSNSNAAVYGYNINAAALATGVRGESSSGVGVEGVSVSGRGVSGSTQTTASPGVYGYNGVGNGIFGYSAGNSPYAGVYGYSPAALGVIGISNTGTGGRFSNTTSGAAVSLGSTYAVDATGNSRMNGNLDLNGTLANTSVMNAGYVRVNDNMVQDAGYGIYGTLIRGGTYDSGTNTVQNASLSLSGFPNLALSAQTGSGGQIILNGQLASTFPNSVTVKDPQGFAVENYTTGVQSLNITQDGELSDVTSKPVTIRDDQGLEVKNTFSSQTYATINSNGLALNAADKPLITRGWDVFTSGLYNGLGRWGVFMEPHNLVLGVPYIAGKGVKIARYNADSTKQDILTVDANSGNITHHFGTLRTYGFGHPTGGSISVDADWNLASNSKRLMTKNIDSNWFGGINITTNGVDATYGSADVRIFNGDLRVQNKVFSSGLKSTCSAYGSWWTCADLAELYNSSEAVEEGDLLMIDKNNERTLKKATRSKMNLLVGINSTEPGVLLGMDGAATVGWPKDEINRDGKAVMALAGQVPTKVSIENGPIEIGDLITISSTPGVGMRADEGDATVGVALQGFDGDGVGIINVLVSRNSSAGNIMNEFRKQVESLSGKNRELEERLEKLEAAIK